MIEHMLILPPEDEQDVDIISAKVCTDIIAIKIHANQNPDTQPTIDVLIGHAFGHSTNKHDPDAIKLTYDWQTKTVTQAIVLDQDEKEDKESKIYRIYLSPDTYNRIDEMIAHTLDPQPNSTLAPKE